VDVVKVARLTEGLKGGGSGARGTVARVLVGFGRIGLPTGGVAPISSSSMTDPVGPTVAERASPVTASTSMLNVMGWPKYEVKYAVSGSGGGVGQNEMLIADDPTDAIVLSGTIVMVIGAELDSMWLRSPE
jgi:hypothetical protein